METLVTVGVAMYNVEKYLPQCLDSIIGQSYSNLEIILVDDGSIDRTGKIADDYASKDSRISVIHQSNKGLGGARNVALDAATGGYITFVDSDDYLMPDFVEYMVSLISAQKSEMAISKNCFTTSDMKQMNGDKLNYYTSEEAVIEFFLPKMRLGAWNKIYELEFLKKNHLRFVSELKTGEGLQFITKAASFAKQIAVGHRKVYVYRTNNPNSATTKANVERQGIGALETMDYIRDHFTFRSNEERKAYAWHYWACHRYCLRQIVESGTESDYSELYSICKNTLRQGALKMAIYPRVSLRQKLVAALIFISPITFVKLQIWKKNSLRV